MARDKAVGPPVSERRAALFTSFGCIKEVHQLRFRTLPEDLGGAGGGVRTFFDNAVPNGEVTLSSGISVNCREAMSSIS